jgi:hypothetical protein
VMLPVFRPKHTCFGQPFGGWRLKVRPTALGKVRAQISAGQDRLPGLGTRFASDAIEPQLPPGTPPGSRFCKAPTPAIPGSARMDIGSGAIWAESTSASPRDGLRIGKPAGARSLSLRPHPLGGLSPARRFASPAPTTTSRAGCPTAVAHCA